MRKRLLIVCAVVLPLVIAMIAAMAANAAPPAATPTVTPHWVTGLAAGSGSTVGPDGALYVPEPSSGKIFRVDPNRDAHDVRALPAAVGDPTRRGDGRRVHRQHPVRAGDDRQRPIRTDRCPPRRQRHLSRRRPGQLHRGRRHRRVCRRPHAERGHLPRDRCPVRDGARTVAGSSSPTATTTASTG